MGNDFLLKHCIKRLQYYHQQKNSERYRSSEIQKVFIDSMIDYYTNRGADLIPDEAFCWNNYKRYYEYKYLRKRR